MRNIKIKPGEKITIEIANDKEFLSLTEAREYLKISRSTLYRLIEAGRLITVKNGKRTEISIIELEKFIYRSR